MIPQITEIGFPSYATLHQANISLSEMGSRIITTQVRIDGDIAPDFSGWALEFKGERFVLPIRVPQATKDNSTRNGIVDLTFYSWAEDQLKRYFFMSLSEVQTGVAIADQYVASVTMPVEQFVTLFNSVLQYYFGDTIRMDLFQMGQGIYSTNPVIVEINYTHIWDVLTKFYETFGLRWNIEYDSTTSAYVIKVNYPSAAIEDHDFEYGYKGGLLKFERQVQDDNITNVLLGRGGEKNLPYRYFKRTDEQNPEWQADPDAVYELRNIYFDRLRDINFRWYVRGWMQNPNRDRTWENQGYTYPTYSSVPAEYQFAYDRGLTDAKFNPVEFVRDTDSIAKYGERWGALDDNDEIYPTIQGVERDPIGRVDEVVAVSEILTDDIEGAAAGNATTNSIGGALSVTTNMAPHSRADHEFRSENFTVPEGKTANLNLTWLCLVNGASLAGVRVDTDHSEFVAIDASTGQRVSSEGLPAGTYYVHVEVRVYNDLGSAKTVTFGVNSLTATLADSVVEGWKPTFDIWVKNIWNTTKEAGESDAQYAARVWEPILGDRVGNEAKIVFSDGFMALSQDYEFVIVSYPVFDQSKMIGDVPSEWRITLRKSDAEFDATGLYIPNAQTGGKPVAGDHFFFTGIDMPFIYVQWAEQNLNAVKTTELEKISDISPTWVITLDKVRVHTLEDEDYGTLLADRLAAGCTVRTKDPRFTPGEVLTLYVQTITYNWEEPTDDEPYLVPDINVVLSDKVVSTESQVAKIQGDIEVIRSTYAKTSDIESVVRRVASPLFLKKTGESDSSNSPTTFASKLSSKSFIQGDIGGSGWGHYDDDEGDAVLELDKVVVRKELRVNSLVVNQIAYVGGKQIMSAAAIECNQVVEDANGYTCFFDQKQGSVANLFVVGDIALGQMFDEENAETRYYCAEVTAVGDNYIVLSKTAKDGSGVPQKGDVIVQYGNKTQTSRQYVIIRDVIGGGYERMLSGLNSVTATGDEYYYAGRQSGQTPRWFVGNASGEHAEYQNGQLNIVGRLSVRKSDGTYQSMSAYIDTVNSVTQNLQEQIDGQIQSWAGDVAPLPDEDGGMANYPANAWSDDATRLKHMGDIYVNNTTGQGYRYTRAANDGDFYWVRITDEEVAEAITKANQALTQIQGYQYLKTALADGSTIVEGGLVLTNLIQLGKEESGQFQVYSGINGLMDTTAKGNGIAAWYGGPMGDKEDGAVSWAKSLFRFDGSGYLASGNIGWNADGSGHIPGITWNGNNITIAGDVQLGSVSGDTVTSMINLLRQINEWFGEDSDGNIYVKSNKGFYSNSFISAFGQSDTGGGGGGGLITRVYGTSGFGGTYSDTDYTNTFNAYAINTLYDRIVALEGASVNISVNVTGSGNAVTNGSYNNGVITLTKGATFLTSVAFADLTAHPTTLAGYGITDAKIQNGVITLGSNTITPLTQHQSLADYVTLDGTGATGTWGIDISGAAATASKLSTVSKSLWGVNYWTSGGVPTNVTGRPTLYIGATQVQTSSASQNLTGIGTITASGLATIDGGVKVTTTKKIWFGDDAYIELDSDGNLHTNVGLYSDSFVSAFGASDTGGGGGGGIDLSAMWTNLQINESGVTGYGLQIDYHHLPTIAYNGNSGFVTSAAWSKTGSTNYLTLTRRVLTASDIPSLTTSKISDLETWIDGKDFLTGNETITLSGVVSGSGTTTITTSIADGKITNAMLANSAITINGSSTALGGSISTASITAGTAGTSSATSGLSIAIPYVTLNKYGIVTAYGTHTHSISKANITSAIGSTTYAPYNSAGYLPLSGGVMTGPISGVTYLSVNRAAQTTYRLDVNGATRLAGNTSVTGTLGVTGATTLANLTVGSSNSITLGEGVLTWDATNSAWKLTGNLYATGFISAFGASDTGGGGGGIDLSAMWANLQVNESGTTGYNLQINPGHLTTALGTYVNAITTTGSGNAITSVSKDGSTLTFTKGSTFLTSHQSLANYVTLNSEQTISAVKTFSAGLALNTDSSWTNSDRALYFASPGNNSILRYYNVDANTGLTYNPNTGALKAGSFVKRGGTASQFLKADGSVDSSVYLTTATAANTYLPLSGGTMDNTNLVTNMNADLLDGFHETHFFRGRGTVPANTDISTYSGTVGSYFLNALQISTITNAPYAQSGLHVFSSGSNYGDLQIVSRSDVLAFRVKWGSTDDSWRDWHKIWHDANSNLSTIDWAAKNITAAGTLKATGATTLSSTLTVAGVTTMPKLRITTKHNSSSPSGGIYYYNGSTDYLLIGQGTAHLWIGANETVGTHHTGSTYISGGDGSVYFSRLVNSTRTNYLALDAGNYSSYALPLAGGTMTGVLVLSNNVSSLAVKDTGGTARSGVFLNSSNGFYVGYGTSAAGYNTYLSGNQIYFQYGTGHATGMTLGSSGNVGIGTTSPAYKLDVAGVIRATTGIFSNGYVSAFGQSTTSDARLKKDFLDTTLTVDDIAHAPAITFLWKDREGKRQAGSLAQYWETVLPEVVTDIEGKKGLDYGAAALVSAITIARDVNDHEKRIRELERENRELKRRLGYADR